MSGTGLDAQLGVKKETTPGTAVTVDRFYEFNTESLALESMWNEPSGIKTGTYYKRGSRLVRSGVSVGGDINVNHATKGGMGLLWKMALHSPITVPTLISGAAFKQVHQPGNPVGNSYTVQVGRPLPSGTVQPFTYNGVKATGWEFSVKDGQTSMLTVNTDGWNEATATALAAATFTAGAAEFGFQQVSVFKLGGTVATATGTMSVTGGVQGATVVNGFTLKGTMPLKDNRRGLGNLGVKAEQLGPNAIPTITGTLESEFSKTEIYDLYTSQTQFPIQVSFVGAQIGVTGSYDTLDFIIPGARIKSAPPKVDGPDVVNMSVAFEAYDDGVNGIFQTSLISTDTVL